MRDTKDYLPPGLISMLKNQHYGLFGHSAAKLCHWTKTSLKGGQECYKAKFYGIKSHRCLQMTPAVAWCQQQCIFCWRPLSEIGYKMPGHDSAEEIIEKSIEMQRKLLSGFGALKESIGEKRLKEAFEPKHVAISLSGEPTIYPEISGLIKGYKKRKMSTFLVSNGMLPEVLENIYLPTQLYLSLESPTKEMHKKLNVPLLKDSWERLNKTLELLPSLKTRKVIRITAVKGLNMDHEKEFAGLIQKSGVDFVEIKSYMHVGFSRQRLERENMANIGEITEFAKRINNHLNYNLIDSVKESRVVLLSSGKTSPKIDFGE